jgi:segregation and condensation protein A
MQLQDEYQITIDNFQGPLDLLLYLIRRAEVDVHDIPIAKITDQYMAMLKQIERIDVDVAGEFLLMAATLIEIKSRVLMPVERPEGEAAGDGEDAASMKATDPRYELVQQLLAYQKYRIAADELNRRREEFAARFAVRPARAQRAAEVTAVELELEDAHALDLSQAYERIIASIDLTRLGDHTVEIDDTPIALHQEDLLDRLQRAEANQLRLQDAFAGQNASQRIGLFLATLELTRLRRISVQQDDVNADIVLVLSDSAEDAPNDAPAEMPEVAREDG